jgi:hypothetical protein
MTRTDSSDPALTSNAQRGSALIAVTVIGLVMTIAFTLFMTSTVMVESRAVEAELAKSRAYWAEMGAFNYTLSRISYSRLCDGCKSSNNKDTDLATVWQAYFNELSNVRSFTYPDEAAGYSITITDVAAADDTGGRQNFSGWLMAASAYSASTLVARSAGALPQMEMRLCVGLDKAGDKCGNVTNNNGGKATTYFSINRLTNIGP